MEFGIIFCSSQDACRQGPLFKSSGRDGHGDVFGLKDSWDFITSHKTILWHTMWLPRDHPVWKGVRPFFWLVCKSVPSGCQISTSASWGSYICRVTAAGNWLFQDHACDSWWQRSGSKEKWGQKPPYLKQQNHKS